MSNIVHLNAHRSRRTPSGLMARHLSCFANARRGEEDVFWLKENAELLNILAATGAKVGQGDLTPFEARYAALPDNLGFYPQYYRFWLSICLDLEDLGLPGNHGEALCAWAAKQGLPEAELSDLQRAEAERLLARRGVGQRDPALRERLMKFAARSETFAIPNKKAAYELTHILFYLSEYGAVVPDLPDAVEVSLDHAGTLAFLEQNFDLLAEICIARAYAGLPPKPIWDATVKAALAGFSCGSCAAGAVDDAYHCYFVASWWAALSGGRGFTCDPGSSGAWFAAPSPTARPLTDLGAQLRQIVGPREDWARVTPMIEARLSETGCEILQLAIAASDDWDRFFAYFSRAQMPEVPPRRLAI